MKMLPWQPPDPQQNFMRRSAASSGRRARMETRASFIIRLSRASLFGTANSGTVTSWIYQILICGKSVVNFSSIMIIEIN